MLHACFQLLSDCVEKENLLTGNTDWNHSSEYKKIRAEIQTLYEWWLQRKNEDNGVMINEQERVLYNKDTEMLIRKVNTDQGAFMDIKKISRTGNWYGFCDIYLKHSL